jgi:hypothetical protein
MFRIVLAAYTFLFVAAAATAKDRVSVQVYIAPQGVTCGPHGYQRDVPCPNKITGSVFDEDTPDIYQPNPPPCQPQTTILPSKAIVLRKEQVTKIRDYEGLYESRDPAERDSAVIVFSWLDRTPHSIRIHRTRSTKEPYRIDVDPKNQRTFYHLPRELLDPAFDDRWTLTTDYSQYRFRFVQVGKCHE